MMFSKRFIIAQLLFIICAVVLILLYKSQSNQSSYVRIPVYGHVSDFTLINQFDKEIRLSDFKGQVWVADFIFTSCGGICPTMSRHMSKLYKDFENISDVKMVSISVNPENDTPAALKNYAEKYNAHGNKWIFLTGKRQVIEDLAIKSFQMGDMKDIVFHSSYFALVDRNGNIRGYYDGTDEERLKQLHTDVKEVLTER